MSFLLPSLAGQKGKLEQKKFLNVFTHPQQNTHLTKLAFPTCNVLRFFSYPILVYSIIGQGVEKENAGCNSIMQLLS